MANNLTFIQFFHWYYSGGGVLWNHFAREAVYLSRLGITCAWLPPPCKGGTGAVSVGYDVYDLFDLGEFDQKGVVATKYGTRQQFLDAIQKAHENSIQVIVDTALNHKAHGDQVEKMHPVCRGRKRSILQVQRRRRRSHSRDSLAKATGCATRSPAGIRPGACASSESSRTTGSTR